MASLLRSPSPFQKVKHILAIEGVPRALFPKKLGLLGVLGGIAVLRALRVLRGRFRMGGRPPPEWGWIAAAAMTV